MSLKSRALLAAIRAVGKKKLPKTEIIINRIKAQKQKYESFKKKGPRIQAKKAGDKFKQKPKHPHGGHGGAGQISQSATHYGLRGRELKVGTKLARASMWHDTRAGGSESWRNEMMRVFGGVHMSQTKEGARKSIKLLAKNWKKRYKKKKVVKALRGALIKKGTKLAYKLATQKYPEVFKKKRFSVAEYKAKKIRKTPELASVGVTKIAANDLRKLAVAEAIKSRIRHLGNMTIKHNKKAVSLFWGKAKNIKQIVKLEKYHKDATKKKLESLGKQFANLTKYQDTLKVKTATKHSEGGEVVFGKNVDKDLL